MRDVDKADDDPDILRLFADIQRFAPLPEEDLRTVIRSGRLRVYEPGEVEIREGEYD